MNYRAVWRGKSYEASPAPPSSEIRLYSDVEADGFEFVRDGRWRRIVPLDEVSRLEYVRTVASWRGEPVLVRTGSGLVEYLGGNAAVAARLGCSTVERGVYRVRVPMDELVEVREDVVVIDLGEFARSTGARSE